MLVWMVLFEGKADRVWQFSPLSGGLQKRAWILDVDCYWFQSGLPLTCWATLGNVLKLSSLSFTVCKMRKIKVTSIIM